MNADAGRRTFVRHMAIGLPALAGAVAVPSISHGAAPGAMRALQGPAPDDGADRLLRRMAALHNDLQRRPATAADARAVAADLRALVGYRQGSNRDDETSSAWRELVAAHGPDRLADMQPDLSLITRGLAYYGVRGDALHVGTPTRELRITALDQLERRGFDSYLEEIAWMLEAGVPVDPIACAAIREMLLLMEAMASLFCVGAMVLPILAPECFASGVVLAILQMLALFLQC